MNTKQFIQETLKGFDYSEREKQRLAGELYEEVIKRDIIGWEDIYEFITEKLDRLNTLGQDLQATNDKNSLDRIVIKNERGKPIYLRDFIGRKDPSLERLLTEQPEEAKSIPLNKALELVKSEIADSDYVFLKELSRGANGNLLLPSDREQILQSIGKIKERAGWVAQAFYDEKEGLVIPGKIRVLSSNPLEILIGRLNQETVAKVYEAHGKDMSYSAAAEYAGVSPHTVKTLWDKRGLVSKHNKLEGKPMKRVDDEKRRKIFEAHRLGLSYHKAGEYAGVSHMAVRDYWHKAGLKAHGAREDGGRGRRPIDQEKVDLIVRCHAEGKGSYETARLAGVTPQTVIRYWYKADIKITSGKNKLSRKEINTIVRLHNRGESVRSIRRATGISKTTVQKYVNLIDDSTGRIDSLAYTVKPNPRSGYKPNQIAEILEAHRLFDGNIAEAARNLPYNYISIREHWIKNGLRPLRHDGRRILTADKKRDVLEAYEAQQGIASRAAEELSLPAGLVGHIWEKNGLKPRRCSERWRPPIVKVTKNYGGAVDLSGYTTVELKAVSDLKSALVNSRQRLPMYGDPRSSLGGISTDEIFEHIEEKLLSPNEKTGRIETSKIYSFINFLEKNIQS